ncbi:TPA: fimbria/pilus periplasmic chaperone [Klebsiella oxytoca]|nr:fimbria/pilus periplasmic chaperone [Klebsiella oxytoca]
MHSFRSWSVFSKVLFNIAHGCIPLLFSVSALAAVNVDITRVIINAGEKSASLSLLNSGDQPMLVQAWVDEGNPLTPPDTIRTPVVILPPVFRMQPGEIRSVRLLLTGRSALPRDRETLYWLNIYQIPPITDRDNQRIQRVILPLRLRLKLFIRPDGLANPTEQDGEKLIFTRRISGKMPQLTISNPTPWYMTLGMVSCGSVRIGGGIIPPRTSRSFPLNGQEHKCKKLQYVLINDSGNHQSYTAQAESEDDGK